MRSANIPPSANFELWKRVIQEHYADHADNIYYQMWQQAASDWGNLLDTPEANLFEQYVMLKQLMKPEGDRDGD